MTNRRPGDIITPSLVRLQAEQQMASTRQINSVKAQECEISKYYKALPPFPNTIIPHRYILRNPREYQVHLESISDFLSCGEGVWWQDIVSGVEILDGPREPNFRPEGPPLHHFRSSNLKLEEQQLKQCWLKCLANETKIPHRVIRLYDDNGDCIQMIYTNFCMRMVIKVIMKRVMLLMKRIMKMRVTTKLIKKKKSMILKGWLKMYSCLTVKMKPFLSMTKN